MIHFPPPIPRAEDRITLSDLPHHELGTHCWLWMGEINRNGYGRVWVNGKRLMVHRVTYELLVGQIDAGLVLDHKCRTRNCCNPNHLEPVTVRENTLRGEATLFKPEPKQCLTCGGYGLVGRPYDDAVECPECLGKGAL